MLENILFMILIVLALIGSLVLITFIRIKMAFSKKNLKMSNEWIEKNKLKKIRNQ